MTDAGEARNDSSIVVGMGRDIIAEREKTKRGESEGRGGREGRKLEMEVRRGRQQQERRSEGSHEHHG